MKIIINIKLNQEKEYTIKGIIDNSLLTYIDKDKTKVILDIKNNILKRITKEEKIILDFNNNFASIELVNINKPLLISLHTLEIKNNKCMYYVSYLINDLDKICYQLKYEKLMIKKY